MRMRIGGLVLACAMAGLAPCAAQAQYYEMPQTDFTGPLSHPRYEDGGFFLAGDFLYWKTNKSIGSQAIGARGFYDFDGSITGAPGAHLGTNNIALKTEDLGPGTYEPGYNFTIGWRFQNGISVSLAWHHLNQAAYSATASTIPFLGRLDLALADSFISAPVFNFTPEFAGNPSNTTVGSPGATYGIWDAATSMQLLYVQRFDMWGLNARIPIWQTDTYRTYGLFGPRTVALWERFKWRTVDADQNGTSADTTVADYFNIISNRLYGVHLGGGYEWFLGSTPIGGFSTSIDAEGALYFDFVNARAEYVRADQLVAAERHRRLSSLVPGAELKASLWWYPWEAIQVHVGFDFLSFFNTVASPTPVDFNFGSINPRWEGGQFRYFHGFSFGIGWVF